ncbi:mycofactocin system-associated heme/flavin dehydrogenase [Actinomadura sp. 7K507]|nr:mycofactocin system-associated heme/flavin dehydrogenase [Actinomadura sp. 7K507]
MASSRSSCEHPGNRRRRGSVDNVFSHKPIETVADAQRRAKRKLPKAVYTSIVAGNESGTTIKSNVEAFKLVEFVPRIGAQVTPEREMGTSLLGQDIDLPVVISPAGAQALHPEGEVAVARAAASAGTAIGHSNFAPTRFEDVAAANSKSFVQLYWSGSRELLAERVERFRRAGAKGLILTLDNAGVTARDWGTPVIPQRIDLPTLIRYSPMGMGNPTWVMRFLRNGKLPDLGVPNLQHPGKPVPSMVEGMVEWLGTPVPTWRDVAWLAEVWGGPLMVKGILSADDARRAVDSGATAIGVSNHGGNNLDTTPSPLRFLPAVVDAVGDQAEITFDSGIRRGADVVKALALGAKAALIGRSWFFGLAADGERGVREVLEAYRVSIDRTLLGLGKSSIHELTPDDVIAPKGYFLDTAPEVEMASI